MPENDFFDNQMTILLKEWDYIEVHIGRFDTIIFTIRQWCISLFTAFLAAAVSLKIAHIMLYAVIPVFLFWMIDALHKSFQRVFIRRGREIEGFLSSDAFERAFADRSLKDFYTPTLSSRFGGGTVIERIIVVLRAAVFAT